MSVGHLSTKMRHFHITGLRRCRAYSVSSSIWGSHDVLLAVSFDKPSTNGNAFWWLKILLTPTKIFAPMSPTHKNGRAGGTTNT